MSSAAWSMVEGRLMMLLLYMWWVAGGANMSDNEPVRRRAMVDVSAMVVTCVEGRPAGGGLPEARVAGDRVWMIVPS